MVKLDINAYMGAWQARDVDRILDFYADDAVMIQSGEPAPLNGKDEIRRNMEGFLRPLRSMDVEIQSQAHEGNVTATAMRVHTSFNGDMEIGPGQRLPTKGKDVDWPVAFFAELNEDGKIVHDRTVIDLMSAMDQLGVAPEAAAPAG